MYTQRYILKPFFIFLLLLMGSKDIAYAQVYLFIGATDPSTGTEIFSVRNGAVIELYTRTINGTTANPLTNARLSYPIPVGTVYIPGSTTINNGTVPDVNGKMPFADIQGNVLGSGTLPAGGGSIDVKFRVQVIASSGAIAIGGIAKGTQGINNVIDNIAGILDVTGSTNPFYETSTADIAPTAMEPYTDLRKFGTATLPLYSGINGQCMDALTGTPLPQGSLLKNASAIAYHDASKRVYFVNDAPGDDLGYIELSGSGYAKTYTGYKLEPNTAAGYNITRMAFAADGYGYALTDNGQDLIRFDINSAVTPTISQLGPLVNDPSNGVNDVLAETGGDMFTDCNANLYLTTGTAKVYRINPNTKIAIYLGTIRNVPDSGINSAAADGSAGHVSIGGRFLPATGFPSNSRFEANLMTMNAVPITTSAPYETGGFSSASLPVYSHFLLTSHSYRNLSHHVGIVSGDTVEYTITVYNLGNINAAGVKLYNPIPDFAHYLPNSTTMSGYSVPDENGAMPFSIAGGHYVSSEDAPDGIVRPDERVVLIKFRVTTDPNQPICNNAQLVLPDINGNIINMPVEFTPDFSLGIQQPACFFSAGALRLAFTGTLSNSEPLLQWSVEKENDIDYYEVEYAAENSSSFSTVARVNAGTLPQNDHQLIDESNTLPGISNYRLKVMLKSGEISYSNTVQLNVPGSVQVRPNPFLETLNLQVQLKTAATVQVRLIDLNGRTAFATTEKLSAGANSLSLKVPADLTPGMYVLELLSGNKRLLQKKVIKQ
ncbi:T9SS type A sorting domain-containing protein [Chitinophaga agrisoli]|uniref:T9SS type A sorting domain-containing protein n=1 Tax=Chitinophaga agrisoli TaxID=2607653 RepID=A0A5B2VZN1_9BACT|nr:T9SS type A sorting domain-containing protein [Chitinophaga agrisoli]KAA2243792.1 T9SS type A sorting domain-containing protein [Chitinophaga agrisoli]